MINESIYPKRQIPKPISQEVVDGSDLILVVIVAWQCGQVMVCGLGPNFRGFTT